MAKSLKYQPKEVDFQVLSQKCQFFTEFSILGLILKLGYMGIILLRYIGAVLLGYNWFFIFSVITS